jgi:hypothetical protein
MNNKESQLNNLQLNILLKQLFLNDCIFEYFIIIFPLE